MRALIADDERAMRTMLRRILEQLGVEAQEAENGLELLALLENGKCDADFAVIDIDMPVLNGTEAIRAIRSSAKYRDMPVVCVSGIGDQGVIRELVRIGVSDYLLKPFRPEVATQRFRNVIKSAGRWRQRTPAGAVSELLLIDPDPHFLAFAKPILAGQFSVIEAASATAAASLFQQRNPTPGIVLVSEGLTLLSESQLVETLRRLSVQLEVNSPEVYLMTLAESVDPQKATLFHGILKKTFVPEQFSAAFRRVVLKSMSPEEKLSSLLEGELQPELLSATQQTIGVLVGQEVFRLPPEEIAALQLPIRSRLVVGGPESGVSMEISLLSDAPSVISISAKMLGCEMSIEEGAGEVLNELANTLAGRIRASLLIRDLDLKMGLPENFTDEPAKQISEWAHPSGFRSGTGDRFVVGIRILK